MSAIGEVIHELEGEVGDVELLDEDEAGAKVDIFELKESADEAPIVKLVNMVLVDAIRRGASDIHLEPYEKVFRIRFRVDGVLHEIMTPPKRPDPPPISRAKTTPTPHSAEPPPPPAAPTNPPSPPHPH